MENCVFKCIFSKWTSLAIVEFNLWLMHSLEVDSPDPTEKVKEEQIPSAVHTAGECWKHEKFRQKCTKGESQVWRQRAQEYMKV